MSATEITPVVALMSHTTTPRSVALASVVIVTV
jgi:hypothetical protein